MTVASKLSVALLSGLLACAAAPALAAVGTVQFAFGEVQVRDAAGRLRPLKKGEQLNEGEAIVTGASGSAQVKMIDGGILAIRPDTELKLDTYRYAGREDGSESALMSLVKGGFRTITGFIGRVNKSRYTINTPTATVGIRGTDHEPFFIPPGSSRAGAAPGTYDKVNDGIAFIASAGVEQNIGKNQMGYAAPDQRPVLLPVLPELFKATPPVQKPAAQKPAAAAQEKPGEKPAAKPEARPEEKPVETPPPPPPPAPQAPTSDIIAPPPATIVQPTEATGQCTDASGNAIECQLDFTTQTASAGGVIVPITTPLPAQAAPNSFDHIVLAPVGPAGGTLFEAPATLQPASNYATDAAGNVGSFANSESGTTLLFSSTPMDSFVSSDVSLGRWQGGSYTVTSASSTQTVQLGAASAHWIFALQPPLGLVQRYSGNVFFSPIAWTSPTDRLGNAGTLVSSSFAVDFTAQKVDSVINVNLAGRDLGASRAGMPIVANYFAGSATASCTGTGCDSAYSASFEGAFAGAAAKKATLSYEFLGSTTDIVQGVVAFQAGSTPQVASANSAVLAAGDAASAATQIASALSAAGKPTEAAQAQSWANQAAAAAAAVNAAVSNLFAASTTSGAQAALDALDAQVANAITVASQTLATAQSLLSVAGPAPLAQQAADAAQASANAAFDAWTLAQGFQTDTNTALATLNGITVVGTTTPATDIGSATSAVAAAQSAVDSAALITPVDLSAATSAIGSATSARDAAQTAFDALGSPVDTAAAVSAIASATSAISSASTTLSAVPATAADLTGATSAIGTASSAIASAQSAVTSVNALAAPEVALAASNSAAVTALHTGAAGVETKATAAQNAFTANGAFADPVYAAPANTITQTAASIVHNADLAAQAALADATSFDTAFTTAKLNAGLALTNAGTSLTAANTRLATAGGENTNFTNARSAATSALGTASSNLSTANSALGAATSANNLFTSDKAAALSSIDAATSSLATANTELTNAQAANAALSAAITAAQSALSQATSALSTASAQLGTANSSNTAITNAQAAAAGLSAQAAAAVSAADSARLAAQTAANSAQSAATAAATLQAAGDLAGAQAQLNIALAELSSATTQLTAAQTAMTQAQTIKTTANSELTGAQAAVTAATNAVSAAITAAGSAQSFAATAQTQAGSASTQQAAASAAAGNAQSAAASAQASVTSANSSIANASSAHTSAQSSADSALSSSGSASSDAATASAQAFAAGAAHTAATNAAANATTLAGTAQTQAGTAQTEASAAITAQGSAVAAVDSTALELASATLAAADVEANWKKAQYSNPAVGGTSNFLHLAQTVLPVTGGVQRQWSDTPTEAAFYPNTNYVLDENKNLIEIRASTFNTEVWNQLGTPILNANVKFTGGTPQDHYHALDGTVYMGRWQGGQIAVNDVPQSLAGRSAHWIVGLSPGFSSTISSFRADGTFSPVPMVRTVIGTLPYTLSAWTLPTDGLGNAGILNSATFSANFTSLTANAMVDVGFPTRGITSLSGTATNMPITANGFEAKSPAIVCSGANCGTIAPNGWAGNIGGEFVAAATAGTTAGAVGTGAGLGYTFLPVVPGTSPAAFSDFFHGLAVFNAAAAPTAGVTNNFPDNGNVRHEVFYPTPKNTTGNPIFLPVARNFITVTQPTPTTLGSLTSAVNTNYLFDATGNLVRVFDTPYVIFNSGVDVAPSTTDFSAPTPLANAQVSFGGGSTPLDLWEYAPSGNAIIRMGRWQGGFVSVTDLISELVYADPLGTRSVQWLVRQATPTPLALSGEFQYTRIAGAGPDGFGYATSPTDSYGNVGTLEGASLAVDFTRLRTSGGVRVLMPQGPAGSLGTARLSARYSDAPLTTGGEINVASGTGTLDGLFIGCTGDGCAQGTNYGGRIRGGFAGTNAEAAWLRYAFHTNYADPTEATTNGRVFQEYTTGFVAMAKKEPQIVAPSTNVLSPSPNPPGDATILSAYSYTATCGVSPCTQNQSANYEAAGSANAWVATPGYTIDASGNLTFLSENLWPDNDAALTITGGGFSTNASAPNGIAHGYRTGLGAASVVLNGTDWNGPVVNRQALDSFHWLRGPVTHPFFLADAAILPLNATSPIFYSQLGAFATDQGGAVGSVSGTLAVNFNTASVNVGVTANMAGGQFDALANGIALREGSFWASGGNEPKRSFSSLTFTPLAGGPVSAFGTMNGSLMGQALEGAGLAFAFQSGSTPDRATGTVVFGNPTYNDGTNPTAPFAVSNLMNYRIGIGTIGMSPVAGVTRDGLAYGGNPSQLAEEEQSYRVDIQGLSSSRVQFANPSGALVKFDGTTPVVSNFCSPTPCYNINEIPAVFAIAGSSGQGPTITNRPGAAAPTATSLEFGFDPATGISWGRWGGGMMNVGDRTAGGTQSAAVPTDNAGGTMTQIDLTARNLHFLLTGSQSGPVVLPTTGTAVTYNLVGGTSPTAFTPGQTSVDAGTLNSAAMTANFVAQTVNVAVNATTPGSGTWDASANNVKILAGTAFFAQKALDGTGTLAVTRDGSSANTAGQILGGFSGPTGKGAGFVYSLNQGGPIGSTVSGAAIFRRP